MLICVWSTFPATGAGKAIPMLFITGFTSGADGGNDPNGKDFLRFLSFEITGFFRVIAGDMERLLKL